ncbi:hypothetical protein [Actinoplanes missouriensis]|uniref:hypothetical protein n=1 Tax=Actinoplanes missouriensis TaxID=1866 RepID=UPI0002EA642F|nr:hypothetical protein [Actinoplanes missouriensis]
MAAAPASASPSAPAATSTAATATPAATTATPSATKTATTAPAGGPGDLPGLNRQVVFATVESGGDKVLTVGAKGVVELGAPGDRSLFVAVPVRPGAEKFLLKTGTLRSGGEAYCLQVRSPGGSNPLQLAIEGCDASEKDQIFTFPVAADRSGRHVEVAGLFTLAGGTDPDAIVQESGEGDGLTSFTVVDRGAANIPALD